ncbi:GNAT family N-acetyltransferase [Aeromicrobium sp. Leaf350]|uniref:GNAT family N-acetyltransferase n=1 Tax=Aeromicrobium sp. Leaf350 TaxID=2876565 RepID=UPI001E3EB010|nr:GNAT family N-acetyltransferase [Aeromicrobium sp. Leaf350]
MPDVRPAPVDDAAVVASMLWDFNTEFETPVPPLDELTTRVRGKLADGSVRVLLVGDGPDGFSLTVERPSVWFDGPVVLLEELYVRPHLRDQGLGGLLVTRLLADAEAAGAGMVEINVDEGDVDTMRFYVRHGFTQTEPDSDERAFYIWKELGTP